MKQSSCENSKILLLGASFETGNLGVSALAQGTIRQIIKHQPDAKIIFLGTSRESKQTQHEVDHRVITIEHIPVRFCKNVFTANHFAFWVLYGLLLKVLPLQSFRQRCYTRHPQLEQVLSSRMAMDITGGDSFSDIYGFRRFFMGFLLKWLVLFLGKPLILLPQTYGPFKKRRTRILARFIVQHAINVYSRDTQGLEELRQLLGTKYDASTIRLLYDVAFCMDPQRTEKIDAFLQSIHKQPDDILVGINISGLLFHGGYDQNNMFGLKIDYAQFAKNMVEHFLKKPKVNVVLVPHVYPPKGYEVESDVMACEAICQQIDPDLKKRLFFTKEPYGHQSVKYLIGQCDFFIGSRMHSCIAALSQGIPTVAIAYSQKFYGVFERISMSEFVADARKLTEDVLLLMLNKAFTHRNEMAKKLNLQLPLAQEKIEAEFNVLINNQLGNTASSHKRQELAEVMEK